jgi:hypothetical protein
MEIDMSRWSLRTKIITGFSAVIGFFLLASASGIIGNSMYSFALWLGAQLVSFIRFAWLPWIITFVILLSCLIFALFWWHRGRNALETLNNMCDLDDSLLRLLPSLVTAGRREVEMQRLLKEVLRDATRSFDGHVHRASILLPEAGGEYLRIWAHHQMPDESLARTRFYIGEEKDRIRGVAGEAFSDAQLHVAHFKEENPRWRCDLHSYIDFDKNRPYPPYRSFVAVPVIGVIPGSPGQTSTGCLGVLCFDSDNSTIFDGADVQYVLQVLARRVASALLIYRQLLLIDDPLASGQTA